MDVETVFMQVHYRENQWFRDQVGSAEVLRYWEYIAVMPLWGGGWLLFFLLIERPMKCLNKKEAEQKLNLAYLVGCKS